MTRKTSRSTRRSFMQTMSFGMGLGCGTLGIAEQAAATAPAAARPKPKRERLPREVWIATISLNALQATDYRQMTKRMLQRMQEVVSFEPDIICLPEVFPFSNTSNSRPPLSEIAERPIGPVSEPFAEFARNHHCCVVCPIYTEEDGRYYNSAVVIDRQGRALGEYRKIHPTEGEVESGITPGPVRAPVFQTDFGKVGVQICFDIQWNDGWESLADGGAEIVFWPSAFGGGNMVNTRAWQHSYCVVSSTHKGSSQICDVSGQPVAWTTRWNHWTCAPLNLEKAFLHSWPYCRRFNDIHARYGRKVRITTYGEEEWAVIESRSPDVKIADVMREFELKTLRQHVASAERAQQAARPAG